MGHCIPHRITTSGLIILCFTLVGAWLSSAKAQSLQDGLTCGQLRHTQQFMLIDSVRFDPATLFVIDRYGDTLLHEFDMLSRRLRLQKSPDNEPIRVCFRKLFIEEELQAKYSAQAQGSDTIPPAVFIPRMTREELFSTGNIQKTGVLSRGISFGNTQNVFVNSVLNLQMEGELSENLFLRATITDQQVPFQPEGNTLQIREFDRVFMEIYNDRLSLTAGDVVFQNPNSQFLRYYKNVQGGMLKMEEEGKSESYVGASLAKGRFASVVVEPIEGVAGPYRLQGPDAERFIVILANSEKIFVDGRQLSRGFDFDYVIDYNLAEITFTPRILITRFTRIRVDFEFADRNFSRSIVAAGHTINFGKVSVSGHVYSERDNPNRPLLTTFSQDDFELISSVGNDILEASRQSAVQEPFNQATIQYWKRDTVLANGERFEIYVRARNGNEPVFRVAFTEVGQGRGNYQLLRTTENGRVFEWVAPQSGVPAGNFEPIIRLPVPNKREMALLNAQYEGDKGNKFFVESALSRVDRNLLSDIDNEANIGNAVKMGYEGSPVPLGKYTLRYFADAEYNSGSFQFIDRLRFIEFDRDWGFEIGGILPTTAERIGNAGIALEGNDRSLISLESTGRMRDSVARGFQHTLRFRESLGPVLLQSELFRMNNDNDLFRSDWKRSILDVSYGNSFLIPGYRYEADRHRVLSVNSDSVTRTSMNFDEHRFYLQSTDTARVFFRLSQSIREDRLPVEGLFRDESRAHNTSIETRARGQNQSLNLILTYRQLENLLPNATERWEQSVLGRADWLLSLWKNSIRSDLSYQVNDGRELQREFIFLQVPTGEGTHTWRDDNGDGLKDLNEFYEAINPDEKNFIKVFVPTDEYIRAFSQIFNYRLNLVFPREWAKAGGIKQLMSKFSGLGSYSLDKRTTDQSLAARLLPILDGIADEDLLSYRKSMRGTVFFNRATTGFGADINLQQNDRRQLLTRGYEALGSRQYRLNLRYAKTSQMNFLLGLHTGERVSESDFLSLRNYQIQSNGLSPEWIWQPSQQMRLSTAYHYVIRDNLMVTDRAEFARQHELSLDYRYMKVNATTLAANIRYLNLDFEGLENSPAGYELLQALRPGNNFTWSFNLTQKLFAGLQLTMQYEGRKSPSLNTIHTGRMQVSALF